MKKVIRLTENDLHRVVKESVKRVLKEFGPPKGMGKNISPQKEKESKYDINVLFDKMVDYIIDNDIAEEFLLDYVIEYLEDTYREDVRDFIKEIYGYINDARKYNEMDETCRGIFDDLKETDANEVFGLFRDLYRNDYIELMDSL